MMEEELACDWESIFDALPDLIMILDVNHRIVRANKAMVEKLSPKVTNLSDMHCYQVLHGTDAPPDWCPHERLLIDGLKHQSDAHVEYFGGYYAISATPLLDAHGNLRGSLHVARNITALKTAEKELKKSHDEIDRRVKERTAELVQARDQLMQQTRQLNDRIGFERFISDLSSGFVGLNADRIENEIQNGLRMLVDFLGIDRSSLSVQFKEQGYWKVLYSFAKPGFEPVPPIILDKHFPWCLSKVLHNQILQFERLDELPPEAEIDRKNFQKIGLRSNLSIPIFVGEDISCIVSFGSMSKERRWSPLLIPRLKLLGEVLANAVTRKNAEEQRRKGEKNLQRALLELRVLKTQLEAETAYLQEEIKIEQNFNNIVGRSRALKYIFFQIEQVAKTQSLILLTGETGTGKELVARAIHDLSGRSRRPLIKINCAALPAGLIESELFGHEKGAFTGAASARIGRFELAHGSTLFLDEIGELPLELQAKLLRVLEEGEFERLGSVRTVKSDARIIASTNRNLEEEVEKGRFRKDLWYRLKVYPITLPPLREREEDILLLVRHFIERFAKELGKPIPKVTRKTLQSLKLYSWPGNVRELMHIIESAMISCRGNHLQVELPDASERKKQTLIPLQEMERDHILKVLQATRWKIGGIGGAATILEIHPNTLRSRMDKLGIRKEHSG